MSIFNDPRYPKGSPENPKSALWFRLSLAVFGLIFFVVLAVLIKSLWFFVFAFLAVIAAFNVMFVIYKIKYRNL